MTTLYIVEDGIKSSNAVFRFRQLTPAFLIFITIVVIIITIVIVVYRFSYYSVQDHAFYFDAILFEPTDTDINFFRSIDFESGNYERRTGMLSYDGGIRDRKNRWRIDQY